MHDVYDRIAGHFSATRYKPWPLVEKYLQAQKKGSVGADIGCGNGKYMRYGHVYIIGCDRSLELVKIAQQTVSHTASGDALRCDALNVPFRPVSFAISIAVIHHLSTPERRIAGVKEVLSAVEIGGTAMIYVWALEQRNARKDFNLERKQDVFVPWVDIRTQKTYERYYHLYKEGELESDVIAAGGAVIESGYERDNWWAVIRHA